MPERVTYSMPYRQSGHSDSKEPSPSLSHGKRNRQSPILEVDEEKTAKKKVKRKGKEFIKSVSPKTFNRDSSNPKVDNKALRRRAQASLKGAVNKTTGFDAKRKVDFSDVDELMGSEVHTHAAMSVAAVKKTSTKRIRKPIYTTGRQSPSPIQLNQLR